MGGLGMEPVTATVEVGLVIEYVLSAIDPQARP